MTTLTFLLVAVVYWQVVIFVVCLCVAAARADRLAEQMLSDEEMQR